MWQTDIESLVTQLDEWDELRQHLCAAISPSRFAVISSCASGLDLLLKRILTSLDDSEKRQKVEESKTNAARPLYLCARHDDIEVLRLVTPNVAALNPHGGLLGNPLRAALFFRHRDVVRHTS